VNKISNYRVSKTEFTCDSGDVVTVTISEENSIRSVQIESDEGVEIDDLKSMFESLRGES
jgi:DNA-binding protein YbaB